MKNGQAERRSNKTISCLNQQRRNCKSEFGGRTRNKTAILMDHSERRESSGLCLDTGNVTTGMTMPRRSPKRRSQLQWNDGKRYRPSWRQKNKLVVRLSATEEQISGSSVRYRRTRSTVSDGERLQRLRRDERVAKTKKTCEQF